MDLLNGSAKYQRYLDRIEEYKKIVDRNEAFSAIQSRVDQLSVELKTKNDQLFYQNVQRALLAVSVIIGVYALYSAYFTLGLLLIAGAIAFKVIYNRTLTSLIHSTTHEHDLEVSQTSFDLQLYHKMQYLSHGVDVKMARISIVRNGFMILFPLVMIAGSLLSGSLKEISIVAPVTVAFMMGTIFWFYFFKDELDDLDYEEMELETYISDFLKASETRLTESAAKYPTEKAIIELEEDKPNTSETDTSIKDREKDQIQLSLKI